MANRRPALHRPYFFELFLLANFALIQLIVIRKTLIPTTTLGWAVTYFALPLLVECLLGVAIRCIVAYFTGTLRSYLRIIRSGAWISDTVRLMICGGLLVHTYSWIKISVPLLNPRLWDRELWELDRLLFLGFSPNIFFLELFSNRSLMRLIDWGYGNIFLASIFLSFGFFLSAPSRRLRIAFSDANAMMWLVGAWLYLALPSLGPAYRFPEVWFAVGNVLQETQRMQAVLMHNYQLVLKIPTADEMAEAVNVILGIAAFPSLHVAAQTFGFLWSRLVWRTGQVIFGVFVAFIFFGSVVTGWHYLIDSIAGIPLAYIPYRIFMRHHRIPRWLQLRAMPRSK